MSETDKAAQCFVFPSIREFEVSEFRISLGLSQAEFANEYGISLSTLKKWERGATAPKVENVASVLDAWVARHMRAFLPQ